MGYTQVALEDKILDMYPEIRKYSIAPRLSFDAHGNAWVVKLAKDKKKGWSSCRKRMRMHAWTIPIAKRLKTSYAMQSKTSKNNTETPVACLGLQDTAACYTATVPQTPLRPEVHPVSQIARRLCENLRNVQKHRLLMQEEIKNVLKNLMFGGDSKAIPANLTGTRKEE